MGRSLVLSFLIITVVFYTMGRPTNNAGKIDYIHSVKNHDFSARTVEKRFFKALRPQEVENENRRIGHLPAQIKRITSPTQNLRITSNLPAKIALPSAKPKRVVSSLPPPFDASIQAKTNQPKQAFKLSQLPSYLPFKAISEKSITRKTVQEQKQLAESQKNAPKVASVHPKELENELMDFQPVEHIYTTPTKPITTIKIPKNKAFETQNLKSAALLSSEQKNLAVARPKKRSLEKVQTLKPISKGRSFTLTALPVKRSPFSNTTSQAQKFASIALPTKADRSEFQRSKTIKVASSSPEIAIPLRAAKTSNRHLKRRAITSLKRINTKKSTTSLARKIRSRRLRAKRYALKRKRTKALLRQTQRKLRRKKRTASRARGFTRQAKSKQRTRRKISSFSKVKKGRKAPRFDTVLNKLNQRQNRKYAEQNRRRVRQQLRRQRQRAKQLSRKTNTSRNKKIVNLSSRNRMTFNPIARYKKKRSRNQKKLIKNKLKKQRRNARRNSRKSNRSHKIKVARLTRKNTSTRKNQRKLKRKLSLRNKKYFNRKVTKRTRTNTSKKLRAKNKTILRKINKKLRKKSRKTQKIAALKRTKRTKRTRTNTSKKLRAKNKTILRKINKKLRKKSRKTQKIAALKRTRTRTRTKLKNNRKKRKTKTKQFTKPRLRKNTKKRRISKKSKSRKKKYKRVARRRRAAKKVFGFNMDGSLNN